MGGDGVGDDEQRALDCVTWRSWPRDGEDG
jgi:hypothetical protein